MAEMRETLKRPKATEPVEILEELPLSESREPQVLDAALVTIEKARRPELDE